jgi:hypothetical protein
MKIASSFLLKNKDLLRNQSNNQVSLLFNRALETVKAQLVVREAKEMISLLRI